MEAIVAADLSISAPEQEQLARLEQTIERGLQSFVDVGIALMVVRESRLYRQTHATFEEYCHERWGMKQSRVYRLMDSAEVFANLQSSPIGELPTNEAQARPLAKLEPEQQREVWATAVDSAPDGKMTAAHVQRVVDEYDAQAEELSEEADGYEWSSEDAIASGVLMTSDALVAPMDVPATSIEEPVEYDSDEWFTPIEFIEAAREVMGSIDLDPASSTEAQRIIQATAYYTQADDGLEQEWIAKNVWLNPPYSAPRPWVEKLIESLEAGSVENAILLVNTANSPLWTRPLWHGPYTVCLLERRVRFWRPDRPDAKGFDRDQMIWYLGSDVSRFRAVFAPYGAIR